MPENHQYPSPHYTYGDFLPADFAADELRRDVLAGLGGGRHDLKSLPPKYFYDKLGSELFEEITRLPEYYLTGAEREILTAHATELVAGLDTLVELGSGASVKTELLLAPMLAAGDTRYVALDVSEDALRSAADRLTGRHPDLTVLALRADFGRQLDVLPGLGTRLVAFLGSTIGNLDPRQRADFLHGLRQRLRPGDRFLLGADLVKPPAVLLPAYDDARGVTAAFNRNVLEVLNRSLDGDFDVERFQHVAGWDATEQWVEMRLRAQGAQQVHLRALDLTVDFADGEELRTEISAKFDRPRLEQECAVAGFEPAGWWTDAAGRFSLSLWAPA